MIKEFMEKVLAWLSTFSLPVYPENNIPDDAELPYITFQPRCENWDNTDQFQITVNYKADSYSDIVTKVEQIVSNVGNGLSIPATGGAIYIYKGSPLTQFLSSDKNIKIAIINLQSQTIC